MSTTKLIIFEEAGDITNREVVGYVPSLTELDRWRRNGAFIDKPDPGQTKQERDAWEQAQQDGWAQQQQQEDEEHEREARNSLGDKGS